MTETEKTSTISTRRVRPWIAGLLTLLGWGVGLYYARKTRAAILMAFASFLVGSLLAAGMIAYLFLAGPTTITLIDPNRLSASDLMSGALKVILAIGVWVFIARQQHVVERGSPARLWGYIGIWLIPIAGAVALALLIRFLLLQPFHTPAASMQPTLERDAYFTVTKWNYGYSRFSFAPFHYLLPNGRIFSNEPERGDIVVFKNQNDDNQDYVKRIIGLPGDEIQMINGHLHINGTAVTKELIGMVKTRCDGRAGETPSYRETLDNGVAYTVAECYGDNGRLDNVGPYNVPADHFFMMGDNRDQSQDSRVTYHVGYVPIEYLVGRVAINDKLSE